MGHPILLYMISLFIKDLSFLEKLITGMQKELEEHTRYITKILVKKKANVLGC
jgi:hypothetical protein